MTEQTNSTNGNTGGKAYNINLTPSEIAFPTDAKGNEYMRATVEGTFNGRPGKRTFVAKGKALEAVREHMSVGTTTKVRVLFSRVIGEDGARGGEFLTAVAMPLPPKQNDNGEAQQDAA